MSRIAIKQGRFVEHDTGKPFTPLGVNYFRVGEFRKGKRGHMTFCPGLYDRGFIEKMMADVAAWGFNTVRTFHVYHVGENGVLASPHAREIEPRYLSNVAHFLEQARKHGIRVIFTWGIWHPPSDWWSSQPLPGEAEADLRPEWDRQMGLNNFRICLSSVRTRSNAIVSLIEALRQRDPAMLPVVMAWELENEVFFAADKTPFNRQEGIFRFAGRDYALSSDEETQALMDHTIVQWADLCAEAIHRADPETLVSTGVFTFGAVKRGGPGTLSKDKTRDARIPARPLALLRSKLDYIDIHLYAWKTASVGIREHLARTLASVEWDKVRQKAQAIGKPVLVGECGVFARYLRKPPNLALIDHQLGTMYFREHVQGIKESRFAGALYWSYGNPDSKPSDHTPPLVLIPQYAKALRETWAIPET